MKRGPSGSKNPALIEQFVGSAYAAVDAVADRLDAIVAVADNLPAILEAEPGIDADQRYQHYQSSAAAIWLINHNMGVVPLVQVFTVGWVEVEAAVHHLNVNQTEIRLNGAMSGYAVLAKG